MNEEILVQYSAEEVHVYINEISETLKPLSLEFKTRNDEVTGKKIWAMVRAVDAFDASKDLPVHASNGSLCRLILWMAKLRRLRLNIVQ